ncbi:hypothetical protein DFH27DRAFT_475481 [Peziza echinospora]|nr:hypothetical protein DFH27DRAFT_475481 [Peziza echinospora]
MDKDKDEHDDTTVHESDTDNTPAELEGNASLQTNIDTTSPIFFWKPTEEPWGILGQWYLSPTTTPSPTLTFNCAEQFMMASKAHLFSPLDTTSLSEIMETHDPSMHRSLGRGIPNFDEATWKEKRFNIVRWGTYYKFTQNEDLKEMLLSTGNRELVEASPRDRIWGVGYGAKNAPVNRRKWGYNLLGKALMEVREWIRREEEAAGKEGRAVAEENTGTEEKVVEEKEEELLIEL